MITRDAIVQELQKIQDPEIHIDIWTLGLIRDIVIDADAVSITMTYTTPLCPGGPIIQQEIREALARLSATRVDIELTFDPPWTLSDELKAVLGV